MLVSSSFQNNPGSSDQLLRCYNFWWRDVQSYFQNPSRYSEVSQALPAFHWPTQRVLLNKTLFGFNYPSRLWLFSLPPWVVKRRDVACSTVLAAQRPSPNVVPAGSGMNLLLWKTRSLLAACFASSKPSTWRIVVLTESVCAHIINHWSRFW